MSKTTFASDTNVSHKTTLPKELEIILKEFQEEFSWNKAPVRLNDDNGNAITPEPLIYEQVDFLNNRLKNLVAQVEERVKQ